MAKLGIYSIWFYSNNPNQKTKRVAVALRKNIDFQLIDTLTDQEGRFILIKGLLYHTLCTIGSIYLPNKNQNRTLSQIAHKIKEFGEGILIIGGDINLPINPPQDTSKGYSTIPYPKLKKGLKIIQSLRLIDTWRFMNPTTKQFSHYPPPPPPKTAMLD
uniref:Endonuclease/exonuclease/phosphatase domain-containing protein n=1 Tax=Xenopus tropicalis TaxID=8364 RepID=A0A803JHT1_XENTR